MTKTSVHLNSGYLLISFKKTFFKFELLNSGSGLHMYLQVITVPLSLFFFCGAGIHFKFCLVDSVFVCCQAFIKVINFN